MNFSKIIHQANTHSFKIKLDGILVDLLAITTRFAGFKMEVAWRVINPAGKNIFKYTNKTQDLYVEHVWSKYKH